MSFADCTGIDDLAGRCTLWKFIPSRERVTLTCDCADHPVQEDITLCGTAFNTIQVLLCFCACLFTVQTNTASGRPCVPTGKWNTETCANIGTVFKQAMTHVHSGVSHHTAVCVSRSYNVL